MTAGLQVVNDSGILQVDELYRNAILVDHQTFGTTGDHTVTLNGGIAPILVLYSTHANGIVLGQTTKSGSDYTWRVNGAGEVFVFDLLPAPGSSGVGLQVFDAAGSLAFDAAHEQFKPVHFRGMHPHPFNDAVFYPSLTQTLSTYQIGYHSSYGWNTLEATGQATNSGVAYAKPSGRKWGWAFTGDPRWWYFANQSGQDGNAHKGYFRHFWSGDNFKSFRREVGLVQGGEYWPGGSNSSNQWFTFVDVTDIP